MGSMLRGMTAVLALVSLRAAAAGPSRIVLHDGRETGLAEVVWRDGWLWLKDGGMLPPTRSICRGAGGAGGGGV